MYRRAAEIATGIGIAFGVKPGREFFEALSDSPEEAAEADAADDAERAEMAFRSKSPAEAIAEAAHAQSRTPEMPRLRPAPTADPLPCPREGEGRDDFVRRFGADPAMKAKYPYPALRASIALNQFDHWTRGRPAAE